MRPMDQVLVLSTKPMHLGMAVFLFGVVTFGLVTVREDAFRALVSMYIAWRCVRWMLLTKPTT